MLKTIKAKKKAKKKKHNTEGEDLDRAIKSLDRQVQSRHQQISEAVAVTAAQKLKEDPSHENADAFLQAGFYMLEALGQGNYLKSSWRKLNNLDE